MTPPAQGSVAVEFFPVDLDALGVNRGLPEAIDDGIHRGTGSGNGIREKLA
jgi:hypothetical protein